MYKIEYCGREQIIVRRNKTCVTLEFLLQPIYEPQSGETIYYEALSKVFSESGELLNTEIFFESINNDFIKLIALLQMEYFSYFKKLTNIFLNLNLSSLNDNNFVENIIKLNSKNIYHIEINDIDIPLLDNNILLNIKKLKKSGIKIILDDYCQDSIDSNLSLGMINWDYIKVDKSFLSNKNRKNRELEDLILLLSKHCKNGVIIEGVETERHNNFIKSHNILAQGYYFSIPKNMEEFTEKD
ncbi:EAL domain-containing protein [Vibrio parahaemolyticus]|uniref:EAL domain-containing protein n=1 Tax=Vibrio parahaemolyticus TaxID=670 RepID=UPI0028793AF6|nr:EAL domain-containing protein [Vibrio parahaemolyticus]MDS1924701.1 EAL domain-containing protein [Vibrio parahaemolyticus]